MLKEHLLLEPSLLMKYISEGFIRFFGVSITDPCAHSFPRLLNYLLISLQSPSRHDCSIVPHRHVFWNLFFVNNDTCQYSPLQIPYTYVICWVHIRFLPSLSWKIHAKSTFSCMHMSLRQLWLLLMALFYAFIWNLENSCLQFLQYIICK